MKPQKDIEPGVAVVRPNSVTERACRLCEGTRLETFLDLGERPLVDRLLSDAELDKTELVFPLRAALCADCSLMQITESVSRQIVFEHSYPCFCLFSLVL